MPRRETFPPPRPCVAISSIPVCDARQKFFINGCAALRKAVACCVTKNTLFTGARQKIPQKSRRSVKRAFLSVGQNFPPAAGQTFRQIVTRKLFAVGAQKVPASEPKEFSLRGSGENVVRRCRAAKKSSGCVFEAAFFQKKSLRRKPGRDSCFLIRYMFLLR